ncbi:aspartic proteinase CDR1-like [Solanum pennellii]|uniref:Aspartic proteinase CDR1-like n=1 Tax=Solanum pennellii TaxID=28526 RepID=A0ABM1V1V5_SOLPN|nr:aspartic proteinase CDR1-like [Solanum pennellii]
MTIFCFIIVFCFAILTVTQTSVLPESEAKSSGFSIELIHSASKRSPASLSMELVPEPLGMFQAHSHSVKMLGVLFTPISLNPNEPFYLLTLVGISVNGKRFNLFNNNNSTTIGNIAIDSGTTLTNLPTQLYNQVETAILQAINVQPFFIENSTNPCYRDFSGSDVPPVTMHFIAAAVPLSKDNIIWPAGQGIWCLAFQPTEGQGFYWNVAQTNFLVGYDLNKIIVSFKPTDCTKMA